MSVPAVGVSLKDVSDTSGVLELEFLAVIAIDPVVVAYLGFMIVATLKDKDLEFVVDVRVAVSTLVFLFREHVIAVQRIQGANPEILVQVLVSVVVV